MIHQANGEIWSDKTDKAVYTLNRIKLIRNVLKCIENPAFHKYGCGVEYTEPCNCGVGPRQEAYKTKKDELETLLDTIE